MAIRIIPPLCSLSNDLRSTVSVTVGAGTYGRNKNGFLFKSIDTQRSLANPDVERKIPRLQGGQHCFSLFRWVQASQPGEERGQLGK